MERRADFVGHVCGELVSVIGELGADTVPDLERVVETALGPW